MSEELKSTQICYGENVLMMRVDDCLIFGNKDALRRLAEKLKEQTAKVKVINCITCDNPLVRIVNSGYCECGALVFNDSRLKYCPQCGCRLEWE